MLARRRGQLLYSLYNILWRGVEGSEWGRGRNAGFAPSWFVRAGAPSAGGRRQHTWMGWVEAGGAQMEVGAHWSTQVKSSR